MQKIIECVPNFSEGVDMNIITQITNEIESVEGVKLLDVDTGKATNRTVVTFVGEPEPVIEAAFKAVKMASEIINMAIHKGEHPRFGATDVCPLVPISGITMDETVDYARKLARRIGEELNIPVYCYENAAFTEERRNLAFVRSGEYEGLKEKLSKAEWKPDFGSSTFNKNAGAVAVGARDFLVAYNVNLNTTSTRRANAIAFDVREKGRILRKGNPVSGEVVKDDKGNPLSIPGSLKSVKAIGWFIEEYGIAQISMNLTNLSICSVHKAFDEVWHKADERGLRVSGSELVGLVPLNSILDAGRYFLKKQHRSIGISDEELIKIAVKSMGLDDLYPFNPDEKIIEYVMDKDRKKRSLVNLSVNEFMNETASESPAPGGGSVSALMGSMGTSLATMVANLSSHKRGWDERWEEFSDWANKGKIIQEKLMKMVDEDTQAFNKIMDAFQLSGNTDAEKKHKKNAIQEATKNAILVPFNVMKTCFSAYDLIEAMATIGNPNSISDAGVGALAIHAAIKGAWLNVKINSSELEDKIFVKEIFKEANLILIDSDRKEAIILKIVEEKIG